jgi:peptide/nickel transport system substrate-binding protein
MSHQRVVSRLLVAFLIASLILSACASATPQAPAAEAPSAETEAPAAATEVPVQEEEASSAERQVLTITFGQEFDNMNPLYSSMWFVWVTWQFWNAWAWEYDENNEPFPKLVTEIPSAENGGISEDGRVITMKLRDDIKWSDGTPITADDFIFTYEMAINPNNSVASTYPYDKLEKIEAPDPQTIVMTFTDPFASWLASMWHGILPAHVLRPVFEQDGTLDNADWNSNPTVGCGPYVFAEWESGSFARFVVDENYWGEKPQIEEIFIRFVPDDASQTAALQAGDAHLGTFIPYNEVPALKDAGIDIVTVPSGYNEGLFFLVNEELGHPALLDQNVRKAIALGIDRESINRDLLLGLTKVPASYWDALPFYNDPPLENYPFDPEEARRLLDEAGWVDNNGDGTRDKDGVELVLSYGTTIREIRQDAQAVIQQQLADIGITVDIASYEDDLYFSNYGDGPAASGEIDIMEWSDGPVFPDAEIYYWLCSEIPTDDYPAGTNWFFLCDEELDRLITEQSTQVNILERQETISQINQLFHEKVYWIGLWQDPDVWAVSPKLVNYSLSGVTPFFSISEWEVME